MPVSNSPSPNGSLENGAVVMHGIFVDACKNDLCNRVALTLAKMKNNTLALPPHLLRSTRMKLHFLTIATLIALIVTTTAVAQQPTKQPPKRNPNPAFAQVEDVPGLPRVLLIGDSISIGYTAHVRAMLKGVANVHRPLTNCGPTTRGLENIDAWLGDGKWDVIHFNWGLHDLKYMGPNNENLADPNDASSHQQVPSDEYESNLKTLVERMQETGATLIWRTTTPVPEGAKGRVVGDSKIYNDVAKRIMRKQKIAIDDQYTYSIKKISDLQRKADVHYTTEGSIKLAEQATIAIKKALKKAK